MRKKNDALGGRLLEAARSIADADGIDAINIRSIAARAGVASGTVYNYFS
ncbi:MAG: helix-turn-helix transcriptional regulator [Lawsonibacter sp.]|nr:helix-turn-helix transcriptional regulator [Lawsonibacter sp.]